MPITSAVIRSESDQIENLILNLNSIEQISTADVVGENIIIVIETETKEIDREVWENVNRLPGVFQMDLIYHNFEDLQEIQK